MLNKNALKHRSTSGGLAAPRSVGGLIVGFLFLSNIIARLCDADFCWQLEYIFFLQSTTYDAGRSSSLLCNWNMGYSWILGFTSFSKFTKNQSALRRCLLDAAVLRRTFCKDKSKIEC